MYDYIHPESLGSRDVISAWLVCLAIVVAVFVYPGLLLEPVWKAQAAPRNVASAVSRAEFCALHNAPVTERRG
jgi:hypothetical protein